MPLSRPHKDDYLLNVFYTDPWHFLAIAKKCQGTGDMLDQHCQYIGRLIAGAKTDCICQACHKAPATRFIWDWKAEKVIGTRCADCSDKHDYCGFYPLSFASLQSFILGKANYQKVARFLLKAFGFDKAVLPLKKADYLPDAVKREKMAVAIAQHIGFVEAPAMAKKVQEIERSIPSDNLVNPGSRKQNQAEQNTEEYSSDEADYRLFP